jgi:AbiV family abortive infection protein
VDLGAVKAAPTRVLACSVVAAARNARGLVEDAELLSGAGRLARAYSLAGLAIEEVGKADGLAALAAMPENLRARAPVGRMLEWHQMKLVTGLLVASEPLSKPDEVTRLVTMPLSEVAGILDDAVASAEDVDRLKQRGLYVDVDPSGQIREPSEVTAAEVREQLARARQAASAADAMLDPSAPLGLADPGHAAVEFSRALVSAFGEAGSSRSPEAAADVLRSTCTMLRGQAQSAGPGRHNATVLVGRVRAPRRGDPSADHAAPRLLPAATEHRRPPRTH